MVNKDRIVPVMAIDRLSLIGETMKLIGTSFTVIGADDVEGNFSVTGSGSVGNKFCNQLAKSVDFKTGVTAAVAYFIPAFGFEGFKIAGTAATPTSGTVLADGSTLHTATLSSGSITVAQVTPGVPA